MSRRVAEDFRKFRHNGCRNGSFSLAWTGAGYNKVSFTETPVGIIIEAELAGHGFGVVTFVPLDCLRRYVRRMDRRRKK